MPVEFSEVHKRLSSWVLESLKNEDIKDAELEFTGMTEKGDNYMGDVLFLEVKGKDSHGDDKTMHLVIKKGKNDKSMREAFDAGPFYLRENLLYDNIFPAFREFEIEKKHEDMFDAVPKCYGTISEEKCEALLMDNLRKNGYELHDRYVPMNAEHIKFVLKNYAKFHAISFAMRDQNRRKFDELTKNFTYLLGKSLEDPNMRDWYDNNAKKALELLREIAPSLAEKFGKKIENGIVALLLELGDGEVEESVITHGDCWNNNFLFKYEDPSKKSPSQVAILDWQLSILHSPVIDLSYFLYIVSSKEQVARFDEFLRYYHDNLSRNIRELGSDPEKLFPFETLVRHWDKYSCYGVAFLVAALKMMICAKEDVVNVSDYENLDDSFDALEGLKPKNEEAYNERIVANVGHFCVGFRSER